MQWLLSAALAAHVGGVPTMALFEGPTELGASADQTFTIAWTDNEQDITGKFSFYYQPLNIRPAVAVGSPDFMGTPIPEAQDVPISDTANMFAWDTSGVPSGTYFVYAITIDPPINPIFGVTPAPVTVQHPGDARWPAVLVDEPDGIGDIVANAFAIRWRATGDGPLTATLRYADTEDLETQEFLEIASGVPMVEGVDGIWTGCYLWDLSLAAQASYMVKVQVTDGAGHSHESYARSTVLVYREADAPDAGPDQIQACEPQGGADPDGGVILIGDGGNGAGDDDGGGGCSCAVTARGTHAGQTATWLSALAAASLAACAARRRRRARG